MGIISHRMGGEVSLSDDFEGYDIIGDVHGCADTLVKLLEKLGYQILSGVYRHRSRQAIFLGDIVDRGPHIREALHLVKNMVDAGSALCIMGNHEYNVIGYTTLAREGSKNTHVRSHKPRHNRLIAETLEQFASYPEEWRMFLDWFKTLPLFIEKSKFRAVHACWDEPLIQEYKQRFQTNLVSDEFILDSADSKSFAARFLDRLTRGTDIKLPKGIAINSRDGYVRDSFRTKFWSHEPKTYRDVVFQPDPLPDGVAERPLSGKEQKRLLNYGVNEIPVFVGHYWLQGKPRPLRDNVACLDYSAVKYGRLAAYRFDGEAKLNEDKFVWVYVDANTDADEG